MSGVRSLVSLRPIARILLIQTLSLFKFKNLPRKTLNMTLKCGGRKFSEIRSVGNHGFRKLFFISRWRIKLRSSLCANRNERTEISVLGFEEWGGRGEALSSFSRQDTYIHVAFGDHGY